MIKDKILYVNFSIKLATHNTPLIPESRKNSRLFSETASESHDSNKLYV